MNPENKENKPKGFFDKTAVDDIDAQLSAHLTAPTLLQKIKDQRQQNKTKKKSHALNFWDDVERYWYVYVFLTVSALFTGTLGGYMGLAPEKMTDPLNPELTVIHFNTDGAHVFLAIVYILAFVVCTEVAFAIYKWLYFVREEENQTQKFSSITGMIVSGLSILGTGIAGGKVIASNIAFLSDFVNIPAGAQEWIVIAIPTLITIYVFITTFYVLSSETAASERIAREMKRSGDINHKTRMEGLEQVGAERLQMSQIKYYQQLVEAGSLTAGQAQAAIRANKTLGRLEKEQGKDIDASGEIGDEPDFTNRPAPRK
jgi:hypothetical protein